MGKKGNKGRKSPSSREEFGDDVIDDAMSTTSVDTYGSALDYPETYNGGGGGAWDAAGGEEGVNSKAVDDFKDGVEQLTEKRASTREAGLRAVIKFMLHSPDLEPVLAMRETVLSALIGVARGKGTESQGAHALRALSVLCVCIGPEEEEAFRSLRRPLRSLITRSRHEGVRVGAVRTLALACFICSSDDDNTSETLDLLADVFSRTSDGLEVTDKVCAAALSGWGLLATTVSRSWVATRMTKQHLRVFRELLSSPDMDVRIEAGENLALLHESRIILGLVGGGEGGSADWSGGGGGGAAEAAQGGGEEEEEEDEEDQDDDDGAAEMEAMDLTVLWEEVVEEMKGFITDSSKKLSRETKKQQRRTFRQLFATIGENEPPEEVVSLQNGSLTVADWAHIKQLNALRSCLQSGFQTQMQSNELLREILGVSKWGGTGGEKPFYSKNSEVRKQQTTSRTRSRHSKQEAQDHIFLGEGAEER
ncbi:conserved unknown protein [Ectocarpus siliculosus]|uniref:Interferon-related developmental regulator N-terminal domain-containing protein n=1 Tax=Ectocarpus siliculosus TaxID=2880 RepID=D8LR70_ECTSI|nr:conserved unknown protein [Ectocarpus siliculosus]|eukprot:CBN77743.1 conserved unknown protein [Ectocarpus siliculosus]